MGLELHTWKIVGTSPLLQNNPAMTMTSEGESGITAGKKKYVDSDEAAMRVYKNKDGAYVHPSSGFRAGILEAAKGRKIGKRGAKQVVAGAVFPTEIEVYILDAKGKPIKGYEQYKARVMVGKAGVLRVRPMYWPWCCMLALDIDRDFITDLKIVTDLLNISGRIVGIGDNRPDTSKGKSGVGTFGRYSAELIS